MATYYANSGSGVDGNAGTSWAAATKTIKAAATSASADGDIVIISASNVYYETGINTTNHNVQYKSKAGEMAILDGDEASANCFNMGNYSGTYYENLEIRNYGAIIWDNDANADARKFSISGCYVHDNTGVITNRIMGDGGAQVGTFSGASDHALIGECRFVRSEDHGAANGASILIGGSHVLVRNTLFVGGANPRNGVFLGQGHSYVNTTASFVTCVATSSGFSTSGGGSIGAIQMGKVINCIVSGGAPDNSGDGWIGIKSDNHQYNCIFVDGSSGKKIIAAGGASASFSGSEISQNPLFADASNLDFTLQSTSPAATAGTQPAEDTFTDMAEVDLSGNIRPGKDWTAYSTPAESNFGGDLTINLYSNATVQYKRPGTGGYSMGAYQRGGGYAGDLEKVDQVPFSLATKGAAGLRGRSIPYCVSRGGNPFIIIETGSV